MGVLSGDDGWVFGRCRTLDSAEYWGETDARHREHRGHVRNLLIACAFSLIAGIVVHPSLLALVLMLLPLLAMEWFMLRRTSGELRVLSEDSADWSLRSSSFRTKPTYRLVVARLAAHAPGTTRN